MLQYSAVVTQAQGLTCVLLIMYVIYYNQWLCLRNLHYSYNKQQQQQKQHNTKQHNTKTS